MLDGRRSIECWKKRVSFFTHLIGVMRSITRRRKGDNAFWHATPLKMMRMDKNIVSSTMSLQRRINRSGTRCQSLIAEETINRMFEQFMDDPEALLVLHGWSEGMKKKEIMQAVLVRISIGPR